MTAAHVHITHMGLEVQVHLVKGNIDMSHYEPDLQMGAEPPPPMGVEVAGSRSGSKKKRRR